MYCDKCKTELTGGSKFCPKCGNRIVESENSNIDGKSEFVSKVIKIFKLDESDYIDGSEYVFFSNLSGKTHAIISRVLIGIVGLVAMYSIILAISFIFTEIEEARNHKFMVYVIRFILNILPNFVMYLFYQKLCFLSMLKKTDLIQSNGDRKLIVATSIAYFILLSLSFVDVNDVPIELSLKLFSALANDSYFDLLLSFKSYILFYILAVLLKYYINRYIVKRDRAKHYEEKYSFLLDALDAINKD